VSTIVASRHNSFCFLLFLTQFTTPSLHRSSRSKGQKHRQGEEDEDYSEEEEEGEAHFVAGGAKDAAVGPLSAEAREALELQFERTLQEYDDEEIGYMEYVSRDIFYFVCDRML